MSSQIIYQSDKVLPYVYICTHRETGEFYIGSRTSKKIKYPSHIDLPKYKTSSRKVKHRFEEFDWYIVAEFFDPKDAYSFEQKLIKENWASNLILNDFYQSTAKINPGQSRKSREAASKRMKSDDNPGKHQTKESKAKLSIAMKSQMNLLTDEEKSIKFGTFGENNIMFGKSVTDFMTDEEIQQWKNSISSAWKESNKIWMHNLLNKNIRVNEYDINEAYAQGCCIGYAPLTHSNYNRSVVTYTIQTPTGEIIKVGNLNKFLRENSIPSVNKKYGYRILSKTRN